MDLHKLKVTQTGLRDYDQLGPMIDFVKKGGFFTKEVLNSFAKERGIRPSPLIKIALFEDASPTGGVFLEDGHHRACSILLGGRRYLDVSEIQTTHWTYKDFLDINFNVNWLTPYDPRSEIRFADYTSFKKEVYEIIFKSFELKFFEARQFIKNNPKKYKCDRYIQTVGDLINSIDLTSPHHKFWEFCT